MATAASSAINLRSTGRGGTSSSLGGSVVTWQAARLLGLALLLGSCATSAGGSDADAEFSVAIYEPDHLTPHRMGSAYNPIAALYAPLARFGPGTELIYVHADSITSDDNITWTILLRDGWTWHDGTPVVAQDYANAWNATAYGPNGWRNNGQLAVIEGYDALNPASGAPATTTMTGVRVVDDTTLEVQLTRPDSQFPYRLTQPAFYPLHPMAFDDPDGYDVRPVGNGPFRMDGEWSPSEDISMVRFDEYRGDAARAGRLTFRIYPDATTAYTEAMGDQVDIVLVPQEKLRHVERDFGDRVVSFQAVRVEWLGFPLWDDRFQDVRVRHAISMAIDRDEINTALFGGAYEPASSLHGPNTIGGGTEGLCGRHCEFHPRAANQLLAQAGGWDGPLELWYPGDVGYDDTYEAIANQIRQTLDDVDDVRLRALPGFAPFIESLEEHTADGPFRGAWGSLYPSMQNQLSAVWASTGDARAATGGYTNPGVDRLIAAGDAAATTEEAAELYRQAESHIMTDFPAAPLFYATYTFAHSENVTNVVIGFGEIELADVEVVGAP
ncbi:peptide ABC transporter substrate-binding protein [Phytoactinopolyspora limicola]|uniref:peptide ABC transporter substrate-binding protein n=1 Tax=Phytoactinopolyspora limicola TaxID=2715536 RepID=UPI00140757D3|nr:ABC transporter substrate-binding protein [Phytoactinopolyspora limicola]